MGQLNFGLRVVQAASRFHYRFPEPALWLLLAASLLVGIPTLGAAAPITLASLLALIVAVQGIARWRITRRRTRGRLVVPLFRCVSFEKAVEVQDTILRTLQDHLSPAEMNAVHRLPAVVGVADRAFASKLCRRLRAYILLQGEIRQEKDGAWSVYAGTCQRAPNVRHIDPHTRDETPAKVRWKWAFQRLTGVDDTPQTEYPFEFAHELRAVIQGTAGQLAGYAGDPERAIRLLDPALAVSPDSTSPKSTCCELRKPRHWPQLVPGRRPLTSFAGGTKPGLARPNCCARSHFFSMTPGRKTPKPMLEKQSPSFAKQPKIAPIREEIRPSTTSPKSSLTHRCQLSVRKRKRSRKNSGRAIVTTRTRGTSR